MLGNPHSSRMGRAPHHCMRCNARREGSAVNIGTTYRCGAYAAIASSRVGGGWVSVNCPVTILVIPPAGRCEAC